MSNVFPKPPNVSVTGNTFFPKKNKISIYIPAIPEHMPNIPNLLKQYQKSTLLPDEVIIHCCNTDTPSAINFNYSLENVPSKIYYSKDKYYCGANRKLSSQYCTGDIIVMQDADDLPHVRRLEVIEYYFDKYDIMLLNHSYRFYFENDFNVKINIDNIQELHSKEMFNKYFDYGKNFKNHRDVTLGRYGYGVTSNITRVHDGAMAVRRQAVEELKWPDKRKGGDYDFCISCLKKYNKNLIIDAPLYFYNNTDKLILDVL